MGLLFSSGGSVWTWPYFPGWGWGTKWPRETRTSSWALDSEGHRAVFTSIYQAKQTLWLKPESEVGKLCLLPTVRDLCKSDKWHRRGGEENENNGNLSQVALVVKSLPADTGDVRGVGSIPGSGRSPGGGNSNHSSVLAGKFHGQRNLVGYSPRGRESRTGLRDAAYVTNK